MTDRGFERLGDSRYLSLETYRENGEGVRTPLWFIEENGKLYVRTPERSGKVKRLRRERRVRLAPCDRRGTPVGEWVEGEAYFVEGAEAGRANRLLGEKYGLTKRLGDVAYALKWGEAVVISIRPVPKPR